MTKLYEVCCVFRNKTI